MEDGNGKFQKLTVEDLMEALKEIKKAAEVETPVKFVYEFYYMLPGTVQEVEESLQKPETLRLITELIEELQGVTEGDNASLGISVGVKNG